MIAPRCDRCEHELTMFGGLAFSPPTPGGHVRKLHLCVDCWMRFLQWIATADA